MRDASCREVVDFSAVVRVDDSETDKVTDGVDIDATEIFVLLDKKDRISKVMDYVESLHEGLEGQFCETKVRRGQRAIREYANAGGHVKGDWACE